MILVDSSVILDVLTQDAKWFGWSASQVMRWGVRMPLAINPVIFSEVALRLGTPLEADQRLADYRRLPLPYEAAFWAGKAFLRYRKAAGPRARALPDFYIGAHAYVAGMPLLTRDPARVRKYFPAVRLVAP